MAIERGGQIENRLAAGDERAHAWSRFLLPLETELNELHWIPPEGYFYPDQSPASIRASSCGASTTVLLAVSAGGAARNASGARIAVATLPGPRRRSRPSMSASGSRTVWV